MAGQAVANFGIGYTEFWDLSLAEYHAMFTARGEYEEMQTRRVFEVARFNAALTAYPPKLEPNQNTFQDFYKFGWEKKKVTEKQSIEEMKNQMKKMALIFGTKPKQDRVVPGTTKK